MTSKPVYPLAVLAALLLSGCIYLFRYLFRTAVFLTDVMP